jgi:putative sigma-54 modulation protein
MKIMVWMDEESLRTIDLDSAEIAEIVGAQIGHNANNVQRVMVAIRDTNAHKGGIDKICRVTAHLRSGEVITVSEHSNDIAVAATKAAERAQAALSKLKDRKQMRRQRAPLSQIPKEVEKQGLHEKKA